jgi:hypothetical protein
MVTLLGGSSQLTASSYGMATSFGGCSLLIGGFLKHVPPFIIHFSITKIVKKSPKS